MRSRMTWPQTFAGVLGLLFVGNLAPLHGEYLPGIEWSEPPAVTPAGKSAEPPSDAIVLFNGNDLSAWQNGDKWPVENGVTYPGEGDIQTKQSFGDCQLHLEWSIPKATKGRGQNRGNSGVYFMPHFDAELDFWGKYEFQILDSYQSKTYADGQAGAVYKQSPPLANAMRPNGEWNTYDIAFTAPKFNADGTLDSPAFVTIIHNGVVVQANQKIAGYTAWLEPARYVKHADRLPIGLQNHGNKVLYRNIWVRDLQPPVGKQVRPPMYREGGKKWPASEADRNGKPLGE